jgi:hypothetical protein
MTDTAGIPYSYSTRLLPGRNHFSSNFFLKWFDMKQKFLRLSRHPFRRANKGGHDYQLIIILRTTHPRILGMPCSPTRDAI